MKRERSAPRYQAEHVERVLALARALSAPTLEDSLAVLATELRAAVPFTWLLLERDGARLLAVGEPPKGARRACALSRTARVAGGGAVSLTVGGGRPLGRRHVVALEVVLAEVGRTLADSPAPPARGESPAALAVIDHAGALLVANEAALELVTCLEDADPDPRVALERLCAALRGAEPMPRDRPLEKLHALSSGGSVLATLVSTNAGKGELVLRLEPVPQVPGDRMKEAGRRFGLTEREQEVAHLAARGRGNRAIATDLGISPWTVKLHLASAYRKAGVSGRTELSALLLGRPIVR